MKKVLVGLLVVTVLAAVIVWQRHYLAISVLSTGEPPALSAATDEGPDAQWFDDYFAVFQLDARTFAIGEPRYHQQNFSYLIEGDDRAVLFDAGPGFRDIRAVAEALTDLPITFVPSHFHFDHTGNDITFDRVAVVDLPHIRGRAEDNLLTLTWIEHLGAAEGVEAPTLKIDEWLTIGSSIDLGGRQLTVLFTPGHTDDSISLFDAASETLFSGDFIYFGPLIGFLPNSNMGDYMQGTTTLLSILPQNAKLFGAHRMMPPGAPELNMGDLSDLQEKLTLIQKGELEGEGFYPIIYTINDRVEFWAEPGWLQDWTPRYPEYGPAR